MTGVGVLIVRIDVVLINPSRLELDTGWTTIQGHRFCKSCATKMARRGIDIVTLDRVSTAQNLYVAVISVISVGCVEARRQCSGNVPRQVQVDTAMASRRATPALAISIEENDLVFIDRVDGNITLDSLIAKSPSNID